MAMPCSFTNEIKPATKEHTKMSHLQEEDWVAFRDELLREAKRRGFVAAGIASVEPYTQEREWAIQALETGRMEGMDWYTDKGHRLRFRRSENQALKESQEQIYDDQLFQINML